MPINLQVFTKCQSSALLLRDWKTNSVTVCPHGPGDVTGRCGVFFRSCQCTVVHGGRDVMCAYSRIVFFLLL